MFKVTVVLSAVLKAFIFILLGKMLSGLWDFFFFFYSTPSGHWAKSVLPYCQFGVHLLQYMNGFNAARRRTAETSHKAKFEL